MSDYTAPLSGLVQGYLQGQQLQRQHVLDLAQQAYQKHSMDVQDQEMNLDQQRLQQQAQQQKTSNLLALLPHVQNLLGQEYTGEQATAAIAPFAKAAGVDPNDLLPGLATLPPNPRTQAERDSREEIARIKGATRDALAQAKSESDYVNLLTKGGVPMDQIPGLVMARRAMQKSGAIAPEPADVPATMGDSAATNTIAPGASPFLSASDQQGNAPAAFPNIFATPDALTTPPAPAADQSQGAPGVPADSTLTPTAPNVPPATASAGSGASGGFVLPTAAAKIANDTAHAASRNAYASGVPSQIAQREAATNLTKARTDTETALRGLKVDNLQSQIDYRDAVQREKERHDQAIEAVQQQHLQLQQTINQFNQDFRNKQLDFQQRKQLFTEKNAALQLRDRLSTQLQAIQKEKDYWLAAQSQPKPVATPGKENDPAYLKALDTWTMNQTLAKQRIPDLQARYGDLVNSKNLLTQDADARRQLLQQSNASAGYVPTNSAGKPTRAPGGPPPTQGGVQVAPVQPPKGNAPAKTSVSPKPYAQMSDAELKAALAKKLLGK